MSKSHRVVHWPLVWLICASPSISANDAKSVFQQAAESIVRVEAFVGSASQPLARASGVAIAPGRVATNCHSLEKATVYSLVVRGHRYDAIRHASNEALDLCILSHGAIPHLKIAKIGKLSRLSVGDRAFAIGNPLGLDNTISEGIISSIRDVDGIKLIQTTAPISPGSSGGGLFNTSSELVGITTFYFRGSQNLNFAVPAEYLSDLGRMASIKPRNPIAVGVAPDQRARLSYKDIPLGSPLEVVKDRLSDADCTPPGRQKGREHLLIVWCNGGSYFGRRAFLELLFREGKLIRIEVVPSSGDQELHEAIVSAFSERYGKPEVNAKGDTVQSTWQHGADQLRLVMEERPQGKRVVVFLEQSGFDKVDRKDF
jgi:hypothetical protein